ncbi:MAG TPA: hypothetical protein VNC50_10130, partial [Planctomycetia bacterium]|nr:hypothetical protein [Planctomycetia bacterium]
VADGAEIDAELRRALAALPRPIAEQIEKLSGTGRGSAVAAITRPAGSAQIRTEVTVDLDLEDFRAAQFNYPLPKIRGRVSVTPERTELRDVVGSTAAGDEVRISGFVQKDRGETFVQIDVACDSLALDETLYAAIPPAQRSAWDELRPSGRVAVSARYDKQPFETPGVALHLDAQAASIHPKSFAYRMSRIEGGVSYRAGKATWDGLTVRHGSSLLRCGPGYAQVGADGILLKFASIACDALPFDDDLLAASPTPLRSVLEFVGPDRPAKIRIDDVTIGWKRSEGGRPAIEFGESRVEFRRANLFPKLGLRDVTAALTVEGGYRDRPYLEGNLDVRSATLAGLTARDMTARLVVDGPTIRFLHMRSEDFYGGRLDMPTLQAVTWPVPEYEVRMNLMGVNIERLLRETWNAALPTDGLADAGLYLHGSGADIGRLQGNGTLDVREIDLRRLPVVVDQIDFLLNKMREGQLFRNARCDFDLDGSRIKVSSMELRSPTHVVKLRESPGLIDLDTGTLDLRLTGTLPKGIRLPFVSDLFGPFRVYGPLTGPSIRPEPLTGTMTAIKRLVTPARGRREP